MSGGCNNSPLQIFCIYFKSLASGALAQVQVIQLEASNPSNFSVLINYQHSSGLGEPKSDVEWIKRFSMLFPATIPVGGRYVKFSQVSGHGACNLEIVNLAIISYEAYLSGLSQIGVGEYKLYAVDENIRWSERSINFKYEFKLIFSPQSGAVPSFSKDKFLSGLNDNNWKVVPSESVSVLGDCIHLDQI